MTALVAILGALGGALVAGLGVWFKARRESQSMGALAEKLALENRGRIEAEGKARIEHAESDGVRAVADAAARAESEARANAAADNLADALNRID